MLTIEHTYTSFVRFAGGVLALVFLLGFSAAVSGQTVPELRDSNKQPVLSKALRQPIVSIYKDVKIGTSADAVRELLGKASIDDEEGFFYEMDSETVQIRLDENTNVRLISVTYSSKSRNAPKYVDIFGDEPVTAKPDGSVYRLVRYPEAGYWVAYSRTGGAKPTITVTMKKL